MDLFEVAESHTSYIVDTSEIFSDLTRYDAQKCRLSDAIRSYDRDLIIGIYDCMDITEYDISIYLVLIDMYIEVVHILILARNAEK